MKNNLEISIDVTDWRDEVLQNESVVTSEDEILDLIKSGQHTAAVARATIVSRELGHAPVDLIRPNKLLLLSGAIRAVSEIVRKQKAIVKTPNGGEREISMFIGRGNIDQPESGIDGKGIALFESSVDLLPSLDGVNEDIEDESDGGSSYVMPESPWYLKRQIRYTRTVIPGWIGKRLKAIYSVGGDVVQEAEILKSTIDEIVYSLIGEDYKVSSDVIREEAASERGQTP